MSFQLSYATIGILNFFSFLLSIPIIVTGVWLGRHGATSCERFLDDPVMIAGILLIIVSLAGLIGVCCRVTCLLWLYLAAMFLTIALGAAFTAFVFIVTIGSTGQPLPGKGYREYRLRDYSTWLQKRVNNSENWDGIKTCLIHSHICSICEITHQRDSADDFSTEHLAALESGCCKPSDECGLIYIGPTQWMAMSIDSKFNNSDCSKWSNNPKQLCFDCDSCKAALLENVTVRWRKVASVSLACLLLLLIIYFIGFYVFRNTEKPKSGCI